MAALLVESIPVCLRTTATGTGTVHGTCPEHLASPAATSSRCGWVVVVQRGSHAQLKHPDRGGRVTVPLHAGETIGPKLLRAILHQAGLTMDEFLSVL